MQPKFIAHRGKHIDCLENTVEAFLNAVNEGYYGVETDIHLTKDNQWVIHHDYDIVSNGKHYLIKDLNLSETLAKPLDNQFGKEYFCPTLEDYLKVLSNTGVVPVIEIKTKNPSYKNLKKMMKLVLQYFDLKDISVISFYPWPLLKLKSIYGKKIHLQLLIEPTHLYLVKFARFFKLHLDIEYKCLTKEIFDLHKKKGLEVNSWLVDDKELLEKFSNWGIDYITTDILNKE